MKKVIIASFLGLLSFGALTAEKTEQSSASKIQRIYAYSQYGGGDVSINLQTNGAVCTHGYFLKKSDAGFQANLSMLLSAYHAQTPIKIDAHTDQKWAGSAYPVCHVYSISYHR